MYINIKFWIFLNVYGKLKQKNHPYKPPLQQCIAVDRLVFKKSEFDDGPARGKDSRDFQTGNFGTEFDTVR